MRRRHADAILTRESGWAPMGCRLESPIVPFPVAAEAPRRGRDVPRSPAPESTAAHVPRALFRGTLGATRGVVASTFGT
jgi:hypothetical protein